MEEKKIKNKKIKNFFDEFESHISAVVFIFLTVMLMIQVISRYVFRYAFTWTEELANIAYVFIVYVGIAAAVKHRKHLRIDFVIEKLPFKAKKILLILSNIVFIIFCLYMMFPIMKILKQYNGLGGAKSPLLMIPKVLSFGIIPVGFILTVGRLVEDIFKLLGEEEKELGASKPTIDLTAAEREWENKKKSIERGI